MFTTKRVPNARYDGTARVAKYVTAVVCACGSDNVRRSYTHDLYGDVSGQRVTCVSCGNSTDY